MVIKMNRLALWHQAKSEYAYAYDKDTLHLVLRTGKNDLTEVLCIHGDPFSWHKTALSTKMVWKHDITPMMKRYQTRDFDFYFVQIKPANFRTKYAFILKEPEHTYLFGAKRVKEFVSEKELYQEYDLTEYFNFPYLNQEDLHHTPSWVKDTIWYQIFPDRFYTTLEETVLPWGKLPVFNHEHYGGNLLGIMEKLPYLADLGITGIYFTPIFFSPSAHKYDTSDYFLIDPQIGTNEEFKEMVKRAHQLGIKVMLDGVFNHCGYHHPFFQDVVKNGEKSIYKDAFFIDEFPVVNFPLDSLGKPINYHGIPLRFRTFAFTPVMPKWNTSNPLVEEHLLSVITYWIKEHDIDGWRLDVSNEVSHEFLRKIKEVSRKAKKETFILGENWDSSIPWLRGDQLDSVMNYDLIYPVWKYLDHTFDKETFIDMIQNYLAQTPKNVMENMFNLVGSHDTIRIKRRLKDDPRRVKLSYLLMFLSCGAPNIYYGDEIGLTGEHDPDNRRCMLWDNQEIDHDFYSFTKKLIQLRKSYPVMRDPDYHFINSNALLFTKRDKETELLVMIYNEPKKGLITIPKNYQGRYIDLLTEQILTLHDTMNVEAYSFMLLKKEETL
jgi:glycosidase